MPSSYDTFQSVYSTLELMGACVSPRGMLTKELTNFSYTLAPYDRFAAFPSRALNMEYLKTELRWYLRGDLRDLSICEHAKIWKDCVTDGRLHSNYGHYLFRCGGLEYAVRCLRADPDSRRAVVPIYARAHMFEDNRDVPCTVSISFRIRNGAVHSTAHMRSQDAIFGMGNDVPFFSLVNELVAAMLERPVGSLTVFVESFHVYARHFDKLKAICTETQTPLMPWPVISGREEAETLVRGNATPTSDYPFTRWLYAPE